MALIKNKKEITITCRNYTYYKNKGYDIPKITKNNKFYNIVVNSEDVNPKSKIIMLDFICDCCGCKFQRKAQNYYQRVFKTNNLSTYCDKCCLEASKETMLEKYGVEYGGQVNGSIKKREETCMQKYGVTHALKTELSKNKSKLTCTSKYGVDSFSKTNEFRKQAKEYFKKSNIISCSKQQKHIADILNIPTNIYFHGYYLDMVYNDNIDIEYDGSGHNLSVKHGDLSQEDFDKRERKRYAVIHSYGMKTITILGNERDILPKDEILLKDILNGIECLNNSNNLSYIIDYTKISTIIQA